jgi:hypothetical protein
MDDESIRRSAWPKVFRGSDLMFKGIRELGNVSPYATREPARAQALYDHVKQNYSKLTRSIGALHDLLPKPRRRTTRKNSRRTSKRR